MKALKLHEYILRTLDDLAFLTSEGLATKEELAEKESRLRSLDALVHGEIQKWKDNNINCSFSWLVEYIEIIEKPLTGD
jgi:hypothetical protein